MPLSAALFDVGCADATRAYNAALAGSMSKARRTILENSRLLPAAFRSAQRSIPSMRCRSTIVRSYQKGFPGHCASTSVANNAGVFAEARRPGKLVALEIWRRKATLFSAL
jgi:hypothetical protein